MPNFERHIFRGNELELSLKWNIPEIKFEFILSWLSREIVSLPTFLKDWNDSGMNIQPVHIAHRRLFSFLVNQQQFSSTHKVM